jgi:hypothetical protein
MTPTLVPHALQVEAVFVLDGPRRREAALGHSCGCSSRSSLCEAKANSGHSMKCRTGQFSGQEITAKIPGLDEIKHGDKFTVTVDRAPEGKIKVTSLSWDEPAMIYPGQVLQVRNKDNQLYAVRRPVNPDEMSTKRRLA